MKTNRSPLKKPSSSNHQDSQFLLIENQDISQNMIFFPLQTQYYNLGDQLINKVLLNELRNYGDLIVDDRGVPEWYIEKLGIAPTERSSAYGMKLNHLILRSCLRRVFSSQSSKVLFVTHPGHRLGNQSFIATLPSFRSLLISNTLLYLAGLKMCSFGISIGPFSRALQILEKLKSRFMYFYSVRDSISEHYAKSIGINKVERFPDIAWLMKINPAEQTNKIDIYGEYILFSFRSATNAFTDKLQYQDKLSRVLDQIVNLFCVKLNFKLVISYQVDSDYEFCKYLSERYQNKVEVVFVKERLEENTMYSIYHNASIVFSNRLHVLLFSIVCKSLPIAVIDAKKHNKIMGIFSDANLDQLVIDVEKADFRIEDLQKIGSNATDLKEKIHSFYKQTQENGKKLLKQVITA